MGSKVIEEGTRRSPMRHSDQASFVGGEGEKKVTSCRYIGKNLNIKQRMTWSKHKTMCRVG